MRYFEILVIAVGGSGKDVHKFGDLVKEHELPRYRIGSLLRGGHIREVTEKGKEIDEKRKEKTGFLEMLKSYLQK